MNGRRVLAPGCPFLLGNSLGHWGYGMWSWHHAGLHSCVGPQHSFPHAAPVEGEEGTQPELDEYNIFIWKGDDSTCRKKTQKTWLSSVLHCNPSCLYDLFFFTSKF